MIDRIAGCRLYLVVWLLLLLVTQYCANLSTMKELIALGESLGFKDEDLQKFVLDQQELAREERRAEREAHVSVEQAQARKAELSSQHDMAALQVQQDMAATELKVRQDMAAKELDHQFQLEKLKLESVPQPPEGGANGGHALAASQSFRGPKLPPFEEGKDDMDAYL
jgi:hypothetical protein